MTAAEFKRKWRSDPRLKPRDVDLRRQAEKRTLTNLYNERPTWLDLAHEKLAAAVAAHGRPADLSVRKYCTARNGCYAIRLCPILRIKRGRK